MATQGITLTFEVPPGESLPAEALADALQGVQDAVRLMVGHLGGRRPQSGQRPNWLALQSSLQVTDARSGSLIIDLELAPPPDGQLYLDDYGSTAVDNLLAWGGEEGTDLPLAVTDRLYDIREKCPDNVELWLGDAANRHRVEIKSRPAGVAGAPEDTEAILYGWLREVNWHRHTAQLHYYGNGFVRLRFNDEHGEAMRRLARQYVEIRGHGRINAKDEWTTVQVGQISPTGSWSEPFDGEVFLSDPNPRVFDPSQVVRASEPFDADEFIRYVREMREDST